MSRSYFFPICAFLLCVLAAAAMADSERLSLSRFSARPGPLTLTGLSTETDLFIPLSPAVELQKAVLELEYVNSAALIAGKAYLSVRFNEATLAQVALDPRHTRGTVSVALPAELWRGGFNKLSVAVIQRTEGQCMDPEAPELWTEIYLAESNLSATFVPRPQSYRIADLSGLLAPGLGSFSSATLVSVPGASGEILEQALPYVSQALAVRRHYEPLKVDYRRAEPGAESGGEARLDGPRWPYVPDTVGMHALVGTVTELSPYVESDHLQAVNGPHVAIDGENGRVRLIVTGTNAQEVVAAARDLGLIEDALNPGQAVTFRGVDGTPAALRAATRLQSGASYRFDALGTATTSFRGPGRFDANVDLPLPPDFYTTAGARGELLLDFTYGPGLGDGSVLQIMVNDQFVHGVEFNDPNGANFHKYRLAVPARLLKPGNNRLTFSFFLRPPASGDYCTSDYADHLLAQLSGKSTFSMPEGGNATILPDLSLLASMGYPYMDGSRDAPSVLYIADESLRGAALTLIGRIAQSENMAAAPWRIATGMPGNNVEGNAIVLAASDNLTEDLFDEWVVSLGKVKQWPYRSLQSLRSVVAGDRNTVTVEAPVLLGLGAAEDTVDVATLRQESALGDLGVITSFRFPGNGDALVTVITAAQRDTLRARVADLVTPAVWRQLGGDVAVWREDKLVYSIAVAEPYAIGQSNPWLVWRLSLSNNPFWWLGGGLVAFVLIVFFAYQLLKRRDIKLLEED